MTREFPDELLSAFLDDELSPADRAAVERHLAVSEADRLLLAELKALRGDMAALPAVAVNAGFTDRVVRAAFAAAEQHDDAAANVSIAAPAAGRSSRRWMTGAAVASAAALAACFLLVVQPWRTDDPSHPEQPMMPLVAAVPNPFVQALYAAMPAENETVVLRLKASKDVPLAEALDAALAKSGISGLGSEYAIGVAELEKAYRQAIGANESAAQIDATLAAAQAVFIEAPLSKLEKALSNLASGFQQPLNLEPSGTLAFVRVREIAEGEPGSARSNAKLPPAGQAFCQKLDASHFRLQRRVADATNSALIQQSVIAALNPQQLVQVLILVEAE